MKLLKVDQLSIYAHEKCLLEPISFELQQTEKLVILGQTGSGKSLIVQSVMGTLSYELSSRGELQLFGKIISSKVIQRRFWGNKISALPQEPWNALDPLMPVGHQLKKTYQLVRKQNPDEAHEHTQARLTSLGLEQHGHQRVDSLSGGMAQRVALACAMAGGASLLLADEPTKGLDASRRDQVVQQLITQTAEGALLLITHDVEVARQINGRVMVIKGGELVEEGHSDSLFAQPKHEYTKELIAAAPQQWEPMEPPSTHKKQTPIHQTKRSTPVLTAQQLSIGRGERQLMSDINLTIHAGEVIGVAGDSGCGKSTLGDTLLGLIPSFSGSVIRQNQIESHRWQKLYQDPTAAVPHSASLGLLLDDLVKKYAIARDDIDALMQRLDLNESLLQRSANHVSGGELQRFCMLRVLLLKPIFLFADEPTSRLDPITAKDVSALLVDVARETNCAVMLVSHDQHMIKKRCDRTINIPNADIIAH
ncbi:MAG: ABC transporter ATP-binding protein [Arenicella sp.]